MAQPNGLNPEFTGEIKTPGITNPAGNLINYALVKTTGTTAVNVFGATAGFSGNFVGMRITSKDDANGNITLKTDNGVTVAVIAKGSQGAVKGTVITATAFTNSGTPTLVSSANSADVDVEVMFTITHE